MIDSTPETNLWTGSSSQVKNFWLFVACLLVIPIPWAIYRWLAVKCRTYTLTTERLLISDGIFNKVNDSLELYRIRDLRSEQPFWLRMFGLENIHLVTTDASTPALTLDYMPVSAQLRDVLRQRIEECRRRKGVRELDLEPGSQDLAQGDSEMHPH